MVHSTPVTVRRTSGSRVYSSAETVLKSHWPAVPPVEWVVVVLSSQSAAPHCCSSRRPLPLLHRAPIHISAAIPRWRHRRPTFRVNIGQWGWLTCFVLFYTMRYIPCVTYHTFKLKCRLGKTASLFRWLGLLRNRQRNCSLTRRTILLQLHHQTLQGETMSTEPLRM
jgi:hypothetical protein